MREDAAKGGRALLSRPRVREALGGISEATLDRWIHAGKVPAPVVLSRRSTGVPDRVAWPDDEIAATVERLIREGRDA